ncbi:MAG: helix-turn-helix transcriptional regulator [Nakamurella sp.]
MGTHSTIDDAPVERFVPARQSARVARAVPQMFGYRMPPLLGLHRGLPGPYLTLVFSLSGELPIEVPTGPQQGERSYGIAVGGLHTHPVFLPPVTDAAGRQLTQRGIQLAVNPLAARAIFGLPAGELTGSVLELDDVVGRQGGVLRERLTGGVAAGLAMDRVSRWIELRLGEEQRKLLAPELNRAWQLIVGSGGRRSVAEVARDVGWSRRHLTAQLRAETGLGAKELGRVSRFQRSRSMMVGSARPLADIAADCGYADQSHLSNEWREFAGCTPGQWIAAEVPALSVQHHDC